jgi:hypothetical protein
MKLPSPIGRIRLMINRTLFLFVIGGWMDECMGGLRCMGFLGSQNVWDWIGMQLGCMGCVWNVA